MTSYNESVEFDYSKKKDVCAWCRSASYSAITKKWWCREKKEDIEVPSIDTCSDWRHPW